MKYLKWKNALAGVLTVAVMLSVAGCAGNPTATAQETPADDAIAEHTIHTASVEFSPMMAGRSADVVTSVSTTTSVTVPSNVTPVKSWAVTVGTTYKISDDLKRSGDTYASSNTAIVTVNATTGQFTPQSAGVAYVVATNAGQSRYFKVTASNAAAATATTTTTSVFNGYNVTILDTTTLATSIRGRINDPNTMVFVSANGSELGSISYQNYNAIISANRVTVQLPDGSTLGKPPSGYDNWEIWFATQFNAYRGLGSDASAVQSAQAENNAALVEEYRQELIRLVNVEREKAGLSPYIVHEDVMAYSQIRAEELVASFSHTRPNGNDAGYEIIYRGNNPQTAITWWMNSSGHKAAILNENRTYVGAGVCITSSGSAYIQMYFEHDPDEWAGTFIFG